MERIPTSLGGGAAALNQLRAAVHERRVGFLAGLSACAALAITSMRQVMYWQDSVSLFARAVELQPQFWFTQLGFGTALTSVGRYDEALEHFQCALQLPGNAAETHRMIGLCLLWKRQPAKALEHFRTSHELRPTASTALMLAHLYSGRDDTSIRDGPQSVRFAEQALQGISTPDGPALLVVAAAHAAAGQFERALQFLNRAARDGMKDGNRSIVREAERRQRAYAAESKTMLARGS